MHHTSHTSDRADYCPLLYTLTGRLPPATTLLSSFLVPPIRPRMGRHTPPILPPPPCQSCRPPLLLDAAPARPPDPSSLQDSRPPTRCMNRRRRCYGVHSNSHSSATSPTPAMRR